MGQCQVHTCEDPGNQSVGHSTDCWRASQQSGDYVDPAQGPRQVWSTLCLVSQRMTTHLQYEHVASCRLGLGSTSPTPLSLSLWWTGNWGWMGGYFVSTHVSGDSEWVLKMDRHLQDSCACKFERHNSQATNQAALRREPVSSNPVPSLFPW